MKDPIDSRQMQMFLTLARRGSLRAAAEELRVTGSAISHSIHVLEESLGTKLFYRPGKCLVLTAHGRYLEKEAEEILAHMERVRRQIVGPVLDEQATLRLAAGFSFVGKLLPDVMREWQHCFPRATLAAQAAERDACLKLLTSGGVDAAVLVDPPQDANTVATPLFDDELQVVMAAGNTLARAESLTLRSLQQKVLLVTRVRSHTTQLVLAEMRRQGLAFRECIEVGGVEALCEMVKVGAGIAFLPSWVLPAETASMGQLVLRPVADVRLVRRWTYVRSVHAVDNLMSRTLLRMCEHSALNLQGRRLAA